RMGDLLTALGDYPQALSYYRQALAMYEKVSAVAPQILRVHYRVLFAHAGIGYMQAKLGERTGALAECSKVNALLNEVPEDTDWQRRMKGSMYRHLGNTHTALAASKNLSANQQQEHWRSARNMYTRSLEIWQKVQKSGLSADTEEIAREIAKCDATLKE